MTDQTHYHRDTIADVRRILDSYLGRRLRVFYGDTLTGRCWNDEWDTIGTLSRSMGPRKIPLLIKNSRSMGGGGLLDHCIIAIQVEAGRFIYEHPLFHTGQWETGPAGAEGYAVGVYHNGTLHAQFKRADQAAPYIAFMKGERWSKAPAPGSVPADESLPALYLRKEPTTDETLLKYHPNGAGKQDVVAYRDAACMKAVTRWSWFHKTKPRRNRSTVNLSFRLYRAVWQPALAKRAAKLAEAA